MEEADEHQHGMDGSPEFMTRNEGCIPLAVAFALGETSRVKKFFTNSKKKGGFKYYDFAQVTVDGEYSADISVSYPVLV